MDTQSNHYVTGDPAFAVDRQGVIIYWNEAAEKVLDYPASKALGQKCWRLLAGQDAQGNRYCSRHCPLMEMAFLHEPVHGFHSTFNISDHPPVHCDVTCLTVFDRPGDEMLLHVCHPEQAFTEDTNIPAPAFVEPDTLSHREVEVLALLAKKVSTRDIAARLDISIRTVRTHIQHLMYKLRVHKRRDAINVGKRLDLI